MKALTSNDEYTTYASPTNNPTQPTRNHYRIRTGRALAPRISHQLLRALVRDEVDRRADGVPQQMQSVAGVQSLKASISHKSPSCGH